MKFSPTLISAGRRTLLASAIFATLVALTVVVENWRGDRAWRECEQALTARGESLSFSAFATPEVPDERNFFKAPVLAAIIYAPPTPAPAPPMLAGARLGAIGGAIVGKYTDLAMTRRRFVANGLLREPVVGEPAAEILTALQPAAPLLDAIRDAARERAETWLPFTWPMGGRMIEVGTLFETGKLLAFRAYLEVMLGRSDAALADLQATLRLAEGMKTGSKTLLQVLVCEALFSSISPAIEEGCRRHAWSEVQLAELQQQFERHHPIAALQGAVRIERAWSMASLDRFDDPALRALRPWWFFHGWAQQNKVTSCRLTDAVLATLDPLAGQIHLDRIPALKARTAELTASRRPYRFFARMMSLKFDGIIQSFAESANGTTRLLAVIALERHWLKHREYPVTLAALAPMARPLRDALDGQPIGYTRLPAENYSLAHLAANGRSRTTWTLRPDR